jgi:hypothetical protein
MTRGYKDGESLFTAPDGTEIKIDTPLEKGEVVYMWNDIRDGVFIGYYISTSGDAYYVRLTKDGLANRYNNLSRTNPLK